MSDKNETRHPEAYIIRKKGISAIWIVPIIAVLFGTWLIIKTVSEKGTFITVQFDNASGLVVGKTEVRYKGLPAGIVTDIEVSEDLQSVIVEIEMVASAKDMLTDKTLFWSVTADISFQGVSGLETIFSGNYINVQPDLEGKGDPRREFIALSEPPNLNEATPGLHINLQTDQLGSLVRNSPVSYKQINVGYVSGYQFDDQSGKVNIKVFIEPDYAHLVKENSRFWNASGFEISGSLTSGVQVKTGSLASIVSGGIAFSDPKFETILSPAKNGQEYTLFSDFQTAEMGHEIKLVINWDANVDRGANIIYQGLKLGIIDTISNIDPQTRKITALAKINPRAVPYLTSETQFYVVTPQVDLGGITNLTTLFKGPYISLRPSLKGQSKNQFTVFNNKPAYHYDEPGLHLVLKANHIESLNVGSGIFYKKQKVGTVQAISNKALENVFVHIHIEEKYQKLVNHNSRFWNASGIKIQGGLQGFEIQTNSLQSVLTGGIEFDKPEKIESSLIENGAEYQLYDNKRTAMQRVNFELNIRSTTGLNSRTRIIYKGEEIGSVHKIERHAEFNTLQVGVLPDYEFLLREQTQFWIVRPNISFAGLSDTDALFGGAYIGVSSGKGEIKNSFKISLSPPARNISSSGLQLTLLSKKGNVPNPGSPITYRGILVGQIDNISLNKTGDDLKIHITINDEHKHLINHFSRFYNASGLTISGGINNFLVKTESTDTLLRGGISFLNPENQPVDEALKEGEEFTLFENIEHAELAGVAIKIYFNDVSGLTKDLKIKHHNQQIGMISRIDFDDKGYGANVYAFLNDYGKRFAVDGTKFWLARTELGLVGSKNITSILEGGFISVMPGDGNEKIIFYAEDIAPAVTELPYGLNIKLEANSLGSIRVGNPVLYRQVKVGNVIGLDLSSTADKVNVYINISNRYAPLVNATSKFWNSSGFNVDASIFSGVNIDSESIETLLSGGVSFATPESSKNTTIPVISQGHSFKLYDDVKNDWQNWQPKIQLND